ncbi:hypothetical protein KP79_PYT03820 [Mizuhopecten yessoensis]|uniref:WAP domain-containing protein n=1 Tax=Mizuhopecten yessoensis TaxID=6573 RepID=A0A210QMA6_MIZYE|nr:hypothetical protein KP79_PYT03820 [Mizuhopecten yessoensis]
MKNGLLKMLVLFVVVICKGALIVERDDGLIEECSSSYTVTDLEFRNKKCKEDRKNPCMKKNKCCYVASRKAKVCVPKEIEHGQRIELTNEGS